MGNKAIPVAAVAASCFAMISRARSTVGVPLPRSE
jgi:hypothetical protein